MCDLCPGMHSTVCTVWDLHSNVCLPWLIRCAGWLNLLGQVALTASVDSSLANHIACIWVLYNGHVFQQEELLLCYAGKLGLCCLCCLLGCAFAGQSRVSTRDGLSFDARSFPLPPKIEALASLCLRCLQVVGCQISALLIVFSHPMTYQGVSILPSSAWPPLMPAIPASPEVQVW